MIRDAIANVIAAARISYFLFIVGGCVAIVAGARRWKWVRNPWFRLAHLAAVYIVVFENVFNITSPLNTAKWQLRSAAGAVAEASSGIGGLLDQILFHTPRHRLDGDVLLFGGTAPRRAHCSPTAVR